MLDWVDASVYGPMVRTTNDAALYLDAVAGMHETDPNSLPHPGFSYVEVLDRLPKNLRIAWSPDLGYANVEPDVRRGCEDGVKAFEEMGYKVDEIDHVFDDLGVLWGRLSSTSTYATIYPKLAEDRERFGHAFLTGALPAKKVTWERYGEAQRARARLVNQLAEFFEKYDLLLTPTLPFDAIDARGNWPTEIDGKRLKSPLHVVPFTPPFNLSGHPGDQRAQRLQRPRSADRPPDRRRPPPRRPRPPGRLRLRAGAPVERPLAGRSRRDGGVMAEMRRAAWRV